jgi:hypothetical protein
MLRGEPKHVRTVGQLARKTWIQGLLIPFEVRSAVTEPLNEFKAVERPNVSPLKSYRILVLSRSWQHLVHSRKGRYNGAFWISGMHYYKDISNVLTVLISTNGCLF